MAMLFHPAILDNMGSKPVNWLGMLEFDAKYIDGPTCAGLEAATCMCMRIHTGAGSHLVGGFM